MSVRNLFEDIRAQPLPEFHDALLVAGWAKMAAFTGKCQQKLMATVFALDAGKTVVQITPIQVSLAARFRASGMPPAAHATDSKIPLNFEFCNRLYSKRDCWQLNQRNLQNDR
jgi:hypothetical protein